MSNFEQLSLWYLFRFLRSVKWKKMKCKIIYIIYATYQLTVVILFIKTQYKSRLEIESVLVLL